MRKFLPFLVGILFLAATGAYAQERTVSGRVLSSEDNSGIPGVNILLKGTTTGVITDADGYYKITVPSDGGTLVFSFIGFKTMEEVIGSRSVIDVSLAPEIEQLSEVVVIGYGSQTKEALTGSVTTVSAKQLEQIPTASFQDALQGTSPGLQVVANDGAPGSNVSVRVRGIGSINASNEPLYVIDGIPALAGSFSETDFGNGGRSSNVLAMLNPNDIESIVVLKDAASAAIYGSRGANGVVLITTKSGSTGAPKIELKTQFGWSDFAFDGGSVIHGRGIGKGLNESQYRQLYIERHVNAGNFDAAGAAAFYDQQFPENATSNTIWLDEMTETGTTEQYDVSVSGGNDRLTYFVSGSYFDQDGIVINNEFERWSTRVKLEAKVTDRIRVSNNIGLSYADQTGITDGTRWQAPFYLAYLMTPSIPIFDENGEYYAKHTFFMGANNPVGHLNADKRDMRTTRIIDNLSASIDIIEGLTFKSSWSFDLLRVDEHIFRQGRFGDCRNVGGCSEEANTSVSNWLGTQTLTYGRTFSDVHNVDVLVGYEAQKVTEDNLEYFAEGFPHPSLKNSRSGAVLSPRGAQQIEYAFNSVFSRINYDYDNTYFLSLSFRRDGSSRFGPDERWGSFGSVGIGYTLSNASFIQSIDMIDFLKLRASFGISGNAGGFGNFAWAGLWGFTQRDYDGNPGAAPTQVANPVLTWESQENINVGLDLTMFNNRLNFGFEWYKRISSDLLLDRPLSGVTGFRTVTTNFGDMENTGTEWQIEGTPIQSADFRLDLGFNITFLTNEITKLPEPILDGTKRREEGRDFQEYYLFGWAGVDPLTGDPLWYTDDTEQTLTNDISQAERYYQGKSATPDYFGAFTITASYKALTLQLQTNYSIGNYVYDGPAWVIHGDGRFTPRSTDVWGFENRWQFNGADNNGDGIDDYAKLPMDRWGGNRASNTQNSSRYLYNGNFIRLKTVNLSYNLPTSLFDKYGIRSVQVYTRLNNFITWVADSDLRFDPEQTINGVYNTTTPIPKTVSLGLNIGL